MKYTELNHSSHPHKLFLKRIQVPYTCAGCKELGFGLCYQCEYEECEFYLHEECAKPDSSFFHQFPENCEYKFHEMAPGVGARVCDACGKDVLGFMYQCSHGKYDLHPCCAKLPHTLTSTNNEVNIYLRKKASSKCLKCQRKKISDRVEGWSYVCVSSRVKYCYHVACAKDMALERWRKHYIHGDVAEASSEALQIMVPSQDVALQTGESSIGRKFWKKAKLVLRLIISAILGDPLGLIFAVVETLLSNK